MSDKNPFALFVTHEFTESADYNRVFEYLESRDNFFYLNYSDPEAVPANSNPDVLQETIRQQVKNAEAVIVAASMLGSASGLVDFQLNVAQAFNKPIVLIQPFGATMSIPKEALDVAAEVVEWDERQITDAIRRAARGEDTAKWDVIEFDVSDLNLDSTDD